MQVWDLSHSKSLEAAHAMKAVTSKQKCASNVAMALSAAINCSSGAKQTPLHIAVEADCKYSIKVVLLAHSHRSSKQHLEPAGALTTQPEWLPPRYQCCALSTKDECVCACACKMNFAMVSSRNKVDPLRIGSLGAWRAAGSKRPVRRDSAVPGV